jgi:RimJ/RimL family protein N-acetyltransferase
MERFELRADNNNTRSIAAMKSIGCKVDGFCEVICPPVKKGGEEIVSY